RPGFFHRERRGLLRWHLHAETHEVGCGLLGFGLAQQLESDANGVLDNHGARRAVLVAERVDAAFADLARLLHDALGDGAARYPLRLAGRAGSRVQRQVERVGQQALLAGTDGIEDAFARERILFHHDEAAAIEREAA